MSARSIAASASAARWSGRAAAVAVARQRSTAALDYIRAHPEIWEVILTGGDPLILSPRRLREVVRALGAIEHVKIIRVHTRVPVVDARPDHAATGARAEGARARATYVVLHANHPRELTEPARAACARIVDAGIPMLSQSVLLRGVNDDAADARRADARVRREPHQALLPAPRRSRAGHGASAHRRSSEGQALMRALRGRLSGLCQPTYVLDIPGGHGKSPIGPSYLTRDASGH